MRLRILFSTLLIAAALPSANAALVTYGPTPYLSAADSPFNPASFSYFYLENFETHVLSVPGVTASAGNTATLSGFSGAIIDSVDGDDGTIDGTCHKAVGNCDSWFADGATGVTWTFNAAVLGSLPTAAGIVWTDGGVGATVTFMAFDGSHNLLWSITPASSSDNDNFGGTGEDRFFGVTNSAGIGSIFMSNSSGGIEMDHLQFGGGTPTSGVPEPGTISLAAAGLIGLVLIGRRRMSNPS